MSGPTGFTMLPALDGRANPCACCPPIPAELAMDRCIAVGFGDAHVERDGEVVYHEPGINATQKPCAACNGWGRIGEPDAPKPRILKRRSKKNKAEWEAWYAAVNALPVCGTCGGIGTVDDPDAPEPEYWDVAHAERMAASDPDHDWRIVLFGPLHGEEYQRQGEGRWVMVESNEGFA